MFWPYHQKLPVINSSRQPPNRNRHLRSKLVSPSTRLSDLYDMRDCGAEGAWVAGALHLSETTRRGANSCHSVFYGPGEHRTKSNRAGAASAGERWLPTLPTTLSGHTRSQQLHTGDSPRTMSRAFLGRANP